MTVILSYFQNCTVQGSGTSLGIPATGIDIAKCLILNLTPDGGLIRGEGFWSFVSASLHIFFLLYVFPAFLSLPIIALGIHSGIIMEQAYGPGFIFYQMFGLATAGPVWRNACLSMNIVEIPILVGISVMWILHATGMNSIVRIHGGFTHYDYINCVLEMDFHAYGRVACREFVPLSAISYTIFALLMSYCVLTIVLCIIGRIKSRVWLVQAYYAEYFQKEPERIAQPAQPVQYAYYIPNYPNHFHPQAGPGAPPALYTGVSPFQTDPFALPSADLESKTSMVNHEKSKFSPQQRLVHQQPVGENTLSSSAELRGQISGLRSAESGTLTPDSSNLSLQPASTDQPISTPTVPISQVHQHTLPSNPQEAQMHIAELTSRVNMLTRELQRMGRPF
ncbi:hypothetical protein L218DRAFT_951607 [Marasmius fiardii PR-910]|nr:hypothetical protein L218DRAFT_951770 [Marasmius fiardii PR-910]KAF9254386.1 hypothetical protein L218DRAFT_951607 [Marasmius fiardii PR-910]